MRSLYALFAAGIALSALAGCASTSPTQTAAQVLANFHMQTAKACVVAQITLASVVAADTTLPADQQAVLGKVNSDVMAFCASNIDFSSVTAFAQTAIPATIKAVGSSSLSQDTKAQIDVALIGLSAALSAAVAEYAPVSASAPVAASQ